MATHFSILAWEIQWTEEPGGGLQSTGSQESDMSERLNTKIAQELLPLQGRNRPPTAWQEGATLFLAR